MEDRKSFLMWNVRSILDLMKTRPKSISTGPAWIFFNSSPYNSTLMSRTSRCVKGVTGNFFFMSCRGSGLKEPFS